MKFLIAISILALVACSGPITKKTLRQDPAYTTSFTVNQPYQQVFEVLLNRSKACYLDRPTSKQLILLDKRDYGKKTAYITLEYVYAMSQLDVILLIDITSVASGKGESAAQNQGNSAEGGAESTRVNVYASRKKDVKKADIIEKWLSDPRNQLGCA